MRMCFNWKVIASLAALCLGIYVVAPGLIASALPVLLVLVCPLSMLLMGGMMGGMGTGRTADVVADTEPVPSRDRQLAELRALAWSSGAASGARPGDRPSGSHRYGGSAPCFSGDDRRCRGPGLVLTR